MSERLNDLVGVLVDFHRSRVKPLRITWNKRAYIIKQVHLVHRVREGDHHLFYFSLSGETAFFKLQFNPVTLAWKLVEQTDL